LVLELSRTSQAPGIARRWLAESFAEDLDSLAQETATLLVSELVTNAVVHGRGRVEIHAQLGRDHLLVEVIDEGPGFTPTVREHDPGTVGGCGLRIVEHEASRWGIREGAAHVWFELPRHPAGSDRKTSAPIPDPQRSRQEPSTSSARSPTRPGPLRASANRRPGRAERAALYRRVADTLERWADLAEQYAEHPRHGGHRQSMQIELERAKRAREAARHGRAVSTQLQ
jgi:anti-sigma regulatory factor (Ser/Thr protein kinase)